MPRIDTRTRLVLFTHRREDKKTTNTGRIALECLANSELHVRGHESDPSAPFVSDEGRDTLLLFPDPDATPLSEFVPSGRPVTLIVPDGTWRQASKVRRRVAGLAQVQCVSLSKQGPSLYRLRSETREIGLSTLEAIARAFEFFEGADVRAALDRVFLAMVERTLWSRGRLATAKVSTGLPSGLQRHVPWTA